MGIVKISDQMHENLRLASTALSRSINAQAEHWMRIGMLAEMYPDLDHSDLCRLLVQKYNLNQREALLSLADFLKTLTRRNIIAIGVKADGGQ